MAIKFILTGGTIDKHYNLSDGSLCFRESSIPDMLKRGRNTVDVNFLSLELLDSLDMSDSYKENLVKQCQQVDEEQIIITHGTDTMCHTAQLLNEQVQGKTIVLVGSMIPYLINNSDAFFNLGAAMTAVQTLTSGVYVVMNGQVFDADNVIKNREKGEFEALKN